ncbi:MAG: class B sortase [Acetobacter sp.]|nr:class B sortase [Bacteroides sp.]MCM1340344.1 class B sortase [Acetobacter sp.]MCM1433009.1 class B sortase [Clostridiales bacterium]
MEENNFDSLSQNSEENAENKKKKTLKFILIFIVVFVIAFCGLYFGMQFYYNNNEPELPSTTNTGNYVTSAGSVENPIDFKSLQKQNSDIYAWIKVDGTKVDYPIVQSNNDDSFYLKHSAKDKSWSDSGAIYTEIVNHKTFNDYITVIYGHNGYGDTMFTTLHKFEKKDFFDSHPEFVIYTTDRKLTYQIISAFKYDDRHIINSFDFADTRVLADFQSYLQNPTSAVKNVREKLDKNIDTDSRIVILSTCINNQKSNRYLVCGVLVKDEKTN